MASAGYSGTPLTRKLGIKAAHQVARVGAPKGFDLGILPIGARILRGLTGQTLLDVSWCS